jgi:hypothetical protein
VLALPGPDFGQCFAASGRRKDRRERLVRGLLPGMQLPRLPVVACDARIARPAGGRVDFVDTLGQRTLDRLINQQSACACEQPAIALDVHVAEQRPDLDAIQHHDVGMPGHLQRER